jgi:hypothetical protein
MLSRYCRDKKAWVRLSECLARRIHQMANIRVPAHSRFMYAYLLLPNELMTLFRLNTKNISLDNSWHYINAPPTSRAALPIIFRSQCLPSHHTLISSHSSVRLGFECFYPSQTPSWSPERWLWRCCWYEFHDKVRNFMTDYFQVWGSSLQPSCSSWPRFNANSSNSLLLLRKNSRYDIFQHSFYSNRWAIARALPAVLRYSLYFKRLVPLPHDQWKPGLVCCGMCVLILAVMSVLTLRVAWVRGHGALRCCNQALLHIHLVRTLFILVTRYINFSWKA